MKRRADQLLVERGLAATRSKAQALLMAGRVFSGEQRIDKPGAMLAEDVVLELRGGERFVSRGGEKLEAALATLGIDVTNKRCVDVGASTGGFTDCLLQRGAAHVVAVDAGHGQLAEKLRNDPRVEVRERTNARFLQASDFDEPLELAVVDASFIGIEKLLPALARILPADGELVALVKPQFEAGREEARRARGVIKDPQVRARAIDSARSAFTKHGFVVIAECESALPGPKGNLEHFVYARRQNTSTQMS